MCHWPAGTRHNKELLHGERQGRKAVCTRCTLSVYSQGIREVR
jgi:hypothetical protein